MTDAPVLVAGAGPAGLTAACTLWRHGVPCRVVDRRDGMTATPKALVLWSGALEVLRRTGVSDDIVKEALPLAGAGYFTGRKRLGGVRFGGLRGTAFPGPLCAPQPVTEAALYDRLRELGGGVEWGTELVSAADAAGSGVRVGLRRGGEVTETVVPWLVGADGTQSRVREGLGIAYQGRTYDRVFLLGDGRLTGPAPADEAQYFLHPEGVLVVVPLPGGGHRVFFDVAERPGAGGRGDPAAADAPPDQALLQELLERRGPGGLRIAETWWSSRFRAHVRLAARFRHGRAFLAGDAAHCHSPAGGQGLNTGVQDGYDLGWKLAGVLRGADEALLSSYEAERRPASARAVRNADRQTKLWMARSPVRRAVRDAAMRQLFRRGVLERRMVPQLAQLDLDLAESPATVDLPGADLPAGLRPGRRCPDTGLVGGGWTSLHEYLATGRHTVLVAGAQPAVGEAAAHAARWAAAQAVADLVTVLWLRPATPEGRAAVDHPTSSGVDLGWERPPGTLCDRSPWLAYVRPDGVVAAAGGPEQLAAVLDRLPRGAAGEAGR